jgi:hypothetical protein
MHEVSQRWALTMSVIAAIEGVVALVVGAFIAPIPLRTDATQLAMAVFIRGFIALLALAAAFVLAYLAGYRIQSGFEPTTTVNTSPAATSSPLLALFITPGPRRDAVYSGALVLATYWLITTLYITALGRIVGNVGVTSSTLGSFLLSRIVEGIVLVVAGAGAGGLGARNVMMRRLTQRVFAPGTPTTTAPAIAPLPQPPAAEVMDTSPDGQGA